jgi:hypothetical protein
MNRSTAQRSRRTQDQAPVLALSVISGVHRGVTYALESRDCRIGSAPDADIVLRDAGVAAEHARLRLERGAACIEATGGDIIVDGEPIVKGRGCRTRLPVRLRLCGAELEFAAAPSRASGVAGMLQARSAMVGGPMLGAALIMCLAYGLSAMAQESPRSADARDAIANIKSWARVAWSGGSRNSGGITRAEPQRSPPRPGSPPRIDEAERELKTRLTGARLGATRVDSAGGRLAVSGQIGKHDVAAWTGIQQWFDQTYGDHLVLTTTVTVADDKAAVPALQPQASWYGDGAYVIAADGIRYYEGAVLESGWTIQSINADRILLSRDGQTMALAYQ